MPEPEYVGAVRVPAKSTLDKYGLTIDEWRDMLLSGGGACHVCGNVPARGILHIDHEHVRGWKAMPPAERKRYVRGITCWTCNSVALRRGMTAIRLRAAADYLDRYASLKASR